MPKILITNHIKNIINDCDLNNIKTAYYKLIDCQIHNNYLESLGCIEINLEDF
jgi:Leu/Phe-tRNA-protein transferase